jgi:hypothetical protein
LAHTGKLSCFLSGISTFLPLSIPNGPHQPLARRAWYDHLIDIAALRGDERGQEAILVFVCAGGDLIGVAEV